MRNPLGFNVAVDYHLSCNQCDAMQSVRVFWWEFEELPLPYKPRGWKVLNGYLVCPKHDVVVRDKSSLDNLVKDKNASA